MTDDDMTSGNEHVENSGETPALVEGDGTKVPKTPGVANTSDGPLGQTNGREFGGASIPVNEVNRAKSAKAMADETAPPSVYKISTYDRSAALALYELVMTERLQDLRFLRQLNAIAAAADGLGLELPDPILAVAQRGADLASLDVLALAMGANMEILPHTVSLLPKSANLNSPEALAAQLATDLADGNLKGDFILFVLSSSEVTAEWENIARDDAQTPLRQFLRREKKRLLIALEPPPRLAFSQFVNSKTGLLPLPWGVPHLVRLAARDHLNSARFDHSFIRRVDEKTAWDSVEDDERERFHAVEFLGKKRRFRNLDELAAVLNKQLDEENFDIERVWDVGKARANEAIGLGHDEELLPKEIMAPSLIKRGLLCSAAFATGLSGGRFLALVRASLPANQTVGLSEMTREEQEEALKLAELQGTEHKTLPPMPNIRDYFDKHADRIRLYYEIESDEKGNIGLAESWKDFQLAPYICTKAPSMAIEYTKRLLAGANDIGELGANEINPLVRIIATLHHHLPAGVDRQDIAQWLLDCALKPHEREYERAIEEAITGAAGKEAEVPLLSIDHIAVLAQAVAETIIDFFTELKKAAKNSEHHTSFEQESVHLRHAMLDHIDNWRHRVMLALFMVLMDKDARPGDHDAFAAVVENTMVGLQETDFVIQTVSYYFNHRQLGDVKARCASACRMLVFFDRAANKAHSHPAWATARDRLLSTLLNYDIRWPPGNSGLLAYEFHNQRVALEQVAQIDDETNESAFFAEGRRIVIEHFLARDQSRWLASSWANWAANEAAERLYDTVLVLLDGPPETVHYWRGRAYGQTADKILKTLIVGCRANGLSSLTEYTEKLTACPDYLNPPSRFRPYIQLYSLFWPAILLFWRLRLFGVEPLDQKDQHVQQFKSFLDRYCASANPDTIATMASGMDILVVALNRAVIAAMRPQSDPAAYTFYTYKRDAAENLAQFLRKRLPKEIAQRNPPNR